MTRGIRIVLFIVALLALGIAAQYLRSAVTSLQQARQTTITAQQQLQVLEQRSESLEQRQAHATAVDSLLQQKRRLELSDERWSERRVEITRASVPRARALELLAVARGSERSVFVPAAFEVSVSSPDQGLFRRPSWQARNVNVALSGTLHLRMDGGRDE